MTGPEKLFRSPRKVEDYQKASQVQSEFFSPDGTLKYSVQKQTTMIRKGEVLAIFTCGVKIATDSHAPTTHPEETEPCPVN